MEQISINARGLRACLPEGKAPGGAKASNRFAALVPGGRTLVFKILSVEVLLGMSALRICMGIRTARYSRVRGRWRNKAYGPGTTYARVIVITLVRGGIARGAHFPSDIFVRIKHRVI